MIKGTRYYDPGTGRFLSEDPIGFRSGDHNSFRYVLNNSINYNDPSGKIAPIVGIIAIGVGGTISGTINAVATYTTGGTGGEVLTAFGSGFIGGAVGAIGVATGGVIGGIAAIPIGVGAAVFTSSLEDNDPTGLHKWKNRNEKLYCE